MEKSIQKIAESFTNDSSCEIEKLAGDASNREYFREKKHNLILCHYHKDEDGFSNFVEMQKFLKELSLPTPDILHQDFPFLVLSNLGATDLFQDPKPEYYSQAVDHLCKLNHSQTDFSFKVSEPAFTKEKFLWELNFAKDHLTKFYDLESLPSLNEEFEKLCTYLISDTKQVPTHRDYHSKNLMISENKVFIIDFQDARLGPELYDLVSLVEDPYTDLTADFKEKLKKEFCDKCNINTSYFLNDYKLVLLQRLLKAAGSFTSQFHIKNKDSYLPFLLPTFKNLQQESTHIKDFENIKTLVDQCYKKELKRVK